MMKVLGLDPGLRITGYACIETSSRPHDVRNWSIDEAGCFRFVQGRSIAQRLVELEADLEDLLNRHRPEAVGVEALFAHYRHPRTAITMAHARGVILLAASRRGLPILEMPPAEIKRSLTGNGRATKSQMQQAVQAQLGLSAPPEPADVADAIAIALCALTRSLSALPTQPA